MGRVDWWHSCSWDGAELVSPKEEGLRPILRELSSLCSKAFEGGDRGALGAFSSRFVGQ